MEGRAEGRAGTLQRRRAARSRSRSTAFARGSRTLRHQPRGADRGGPRELLQHGAERPAGRTRDHARGHRDHEYDHLREPHPDQEPAQDQRQGSWGRQGQDRGGGERRQGRVPDREGARSSRSCWTSRSWCRLESLHTRATKGERTMISNALQNAFNDQIHKEFYSSYLYLAMAAHFESVNLPGFASWMKKQADEERSHAMRLWDHVYDRGGKVDSRRSSSRRRRSANRWKCSSRFWRTS